MASILTPGRWLRKLFIGVVALVGPFAIFAGLAWWSLHTAWFSNLVRARIVTALQTASGGRVELGSFTFNSDNLQAGISRLVIHGSEPVGAPPLLSIDSAGIGLKILSVWHRNVDLQSIVIHHPQIHLIVNSDGTTNVPKPRRKSGDAMAQLLNLKAKRLEVVQGLLQVNRRSAAFDFVSRDVGLLLSYNFDGPSYNVSLDSSSVKVAYGKSPLPPMRLVARGRLFQNRADIQQFKLVLERDLGTIDVTGKIEQFAHPYADASLQASVSVDELAKLGDLNAELRNGRATAAGVVHFDFAPNQFTFNGKASAHGVDYVSQAFTLRNISAGADMLANNDGMLLRNAQAQAKGAHFAGDGSIKAYKLLQVQGRVSQVALDVVGSYLTKQSFPWSGTAHGSAHASARLTGTPNLIIGAKVDIEAGKSGIPTSGNLDITYESLNTKIEFGESNLHLPNSAASFHGSLNSDLFIRADTTGLADLRPLLTIAGAPLSDMDLPELNLGGSAHFDGSLRSLLHQPFISGDIALTKFKFHNYDWDALTGQLALSDGQLSVSRFQLQETGASMSGAASSELRHWSFDENTPVRVNARFSNLNIVKTAALFTNASLPVIQGVASGTIDLHGTWNKPQGTTSVRVTNLDAYGEQLNQMRFKAALDGNSVRLNDGKVESGAAQFSFSGVYQHSPADWSVGGVALKADTNGFPISSIALVRKYIPAIHGQAEIHLDASGKWRGNSFEPLNLNGGAQVEHVSFNGRELGNVSVNAATQGTFIDFKYSGDLRETRFHGAAQAQLTAGTPLRGDVQMDRIGLATLKSLASDAKLILPLDGFIDGSVGFSGLLEEPARIQARVTIKDLQISSLNRLAAGLAAPDIVLRNNQPILIDLAAGVLHVSKFEVEGRDTSVKITGSAPLLDGKPLDITAIGTADLALFSLFDPNVRSSGRSELEANITGPISAPNVTGTLQLRNGSFFMSAVPNGLSDVNGTVLFNRNRATIQKMSAHSGGGDISLGGTLSFGAGSPLVYHLEGAARNVRVRYANSISVTANSDLRLSGTSTSGLLSGTLTITRVVFTPNADAGNLLAAASSVAPAPGDEEDFISGLHLDIVVESAPSLQVSTNLSRDVEAEIQLRLRGTPDHPVVLGNITANQGDIKIFGTRFSLNRGEVTFVNAVRVEPVLDLDLETQARGVTVDITVAGTPSKLNFNYRSDPPLQPRDIIALLTVGRAPGVGATSNAQAGSDVGALKSGVSSVLGQAISPVSNRLSKLFGIANIKIDPFVQGITNTPQARLSVEQQISRDVTVTYVTNLSQTSEQIFRFEWALSRQFSVVALRDDNGEFGIDFQYKKRFK